MLNKLGLSIGGGPQRPTRYLDSVLTSAVFDLDATLGASYPGTGQLWNNLVATPADGTAQSVFHFTLGAANSAAADDPVFTGAPNDAASYWALDGGDFFRCPTAFQFPALLSNTSTGPDFTFVTAFRFQLNNQEQRLFSTQNNAAVPTGLTVGIDNQERIFLRQYGASASAVVAHDGVILTSGTDYLCIVTHQKATNTARFWVNARTGTDRTLAFNATSNNSSNTLSLCARAGGNNEFLPTGSRYYHASLFNAFIGDTEAAKIIDHLNERHDRVYA